MHHALLVQCKRCHLVAISWKYLKQRSLICGVIDDHSRSFKAIDKRLFWCKSKFREQLKPWRKSPLATSSCTRPEDNKQQLIWKCFSFKEYFWSRKPRFRKIFARRESKIWNPDKNWCKRLTHKPVWWKRRLCHFCPFHCFTVNRYALITQFQDYHFGPRYCCCYLFTVLRLQFCRDANMEHISVLIFPRPC